MTDENNIINKIYAGIEAVHVKKSDTTENSSERELQAELKAREKHNLWLAIQLSEASEHIAELDAIIAKLKTAIAEYEHKTEHHAAAVRRVEELTKQLKYANQAIAHHMAANHQLGPALDTAREQVTRLTKQLEAKEIEIE